MQSPSVQDEDRVGAGAKPASRMRLLPELKRGELWTYFGPAFVASVAYIDPGNFAANIEGGTRFGYGLLWVLLWSNLMAMLVQYLSAKLGIVTGRTLPQNCRDHFSPALNLLCWVAAEVAAIATDLAEFFGRSARVLSAVWPSAVGAWAEQDFGDVDCGVADDGLRISDTGFGS